MGVNQLCKKCSSLLNAQWVDTTEHEKLRWTIKGASRVLWCALKAQLPSSNETTITEDHILQHHNGSDLQLSAADGCHVCFLINVQVESLRAKDPTSFDHIRQSSSCWPQLDNWPHVHQPLSLDRADFVFIFDDGKTYERVSIRLDFRKDGGGFQAIDVAEPWRESIIQPVLNWADQCIKSHEVCRQNSRRAFDAVDVDSRPARFLQLCGADTSSAKLALRLFESRSLEESPQYVALSHCWGPDGCAIQLKTYNYTEFLDNIDINTLPRTFAEAAYYTQKLGLRYLWIDALCIVQDSKEDWARESVKMCTVYSYSFVTLAATGSSSGQGGLLCQTSNELANVCAFQADFQDTDLPKGLWTADIPARMARYVDGAPLNNRAWVLQEALLSPRTVAFAQDHVRWYCATESHSESGSLANEAKTGPGLRGNEAWGKMMERYTDLGITKQSDKLAAIAGLAQVYGHAAGYPKEDYLAGLWRQNLIKDLLWNRGNAQTRLNNVSDEFIAPSWSWASLGARCGPATACDDIIIDPNLQITHAVVEPRNQYGPLKSGHIDFKGRLHPGMLHGDYSVSLWGQRYRITGPMAFYEAVTIDLSLDEPSRLEQGDMQCSFLMLGTFPLSFTVPRVRTGTATRGLLLELAGNERGVHRRIGTMHMSFFDPLSGGSLPWKSSCVELKETEYHTAHGSGIYGFRLI